MWEELIGAVVVLDMVPPYVYIGRLEGERAGMLILADADAHDLRDSNTTRERYVLDSRLHGVRTNRTRVLVDLRQIAAVTRLEDVLEF